MQSLRSAVSLVLGVPSALVILLNWLVVVAVAVHAARRGRRETFSFCLPFVGGVAGAVACLVSPSPGAWRWAWIPPLVDPSIAVLLAASVLHVFARARGLPSPFDREPPPRRHEQTPA